jgi:oligopeptide/dipeptide ABC transporter ATP-binding protein
MDVDTGGFERRHDAGKLALGFPPPGCRFHTRCPLAFERCRVEVPAMKEVAPGHFAACHLREGRVV